MSEKKLTEQQLLDLVKGDPAEDNVVISLKVGDQPTQYTVVSRDYWQALNTRIKSLGRSRI